MIDRANTPGDDPQIRRPDRQWLSEVLGVTLTDLQSRVIGDSRGFLSTTWQLQIRTEPAGVLPGSLVLKSESSNPLFQEIGRDRRSFEREASFYRELAPQIEGHLPRVYGTGQDGDSWLLMEDLSHLRAGDQVRGLSQGEVRTVVRQIAAIHAQFWNDASL